MECRGTGYKLSQNLLTEVSVVVFYDIPESAVESCDLDQKMG